MRNHRLIRKRGRKTKKEAFEVDITSLLDVLVIILVFLLKNYNSSGLIVNIPEGIKLPASKSQDLNTAGVIVQVSQEKIWVDNELLIEDTLETKEYDQGGRRIIALFNELVKKRNLVKEIEKRAENAKPFSGVINLVVDKEVKYTYLKKLLFTSAQAGYKAYKFIVLAEEQ